MNDFKKLQILLQLTGKQKAASTVSSIENLSFLRKTLKEIPILKGNYRFGENKNVRVRLYLVDKLVN